MDTVTYCVYKNVYGNSLVLQENNFLNLENARQSDFQFYGVNPDFRPIPTGMVVFSIKSNSIGTASTEVKVERDPYEKYKDCVYVCVWLYKLPHTIPIYVAYSPTKQVVKMSQIPLSGVDNTFTQTWMWYTVNTSSIKFKLEQQLCIPNTVNGIDLKACTKLEIINPTILRYVSTYKKFPESIEKRIDYYITIILFGMIFFAYIIKNVYSNYRISR